MSIRPLLLVLLGLSAVAQTDRYFTVGNIGVRIGDSEVTVLASLRSLYQVNKVAGETYSVGQQSGATYNNIGTVSFENNALVSAGSYWQESFDANTVTFAKRVIEALQHQQVATPRTAIVRAIHQGSDLAPVDGVEIVIGDRAIDITTSNAVAAGKPSQGYAAVVETLHQHSFAAGLAKEASPPSK